MEENKKNPKFIKQDSLYNFPYHYLPENIEQKITKPFRVHYWLYDYLFMVNYLINRVNQFQFENLLDFGCGDGRLINDLKKIKIRNIYGYEISEQAALFFNAFNSGTKLIKNLKELSDYNNFFDIIIFSEVIEHIPDGQIKENIDAIYESLKNNGFLIITAPSENYPVHNKHYRHYNLEKLLKSFDMSKFELIDKKFLFKKNIFKTFFRKIFFNRYFLINSNLLFKAFYYLNNFFFFSEEKNCETIFLLLKKK